MFLRVLRNTARPFLVSSGRSLHLTPCRRAVENKQVFFEAFQKTSLFTKLAHHPDAVAALEEFAKLLQAKGVDLSSGKPPSTFQMLKLATNPEFRDSVKHVGEELQKAGVDFQSQELMRELTDLMKMKNSGGSEGHI